MVARLRRPGFIRDVLILAGGAAGAQAINVAISPVLTRFFKPTEIGTLGLFLSFIYVAAIVLSLRYEQAIVVPKDEAVAARVAILAAGLVPVVAPLAALILLGLIAFDVAGYGSLPTLVVPLAVVALLATGWFGVVRYWLIRGQAYRVISEVQFAQAVGRAVGQVVLGIAGLGVTGLLVADAVGRYVGLGRMVGAVRLAIVRLRDSTSESYRSIAREHWRFPAFGVPSSLMNAAVVALPVPLLAGTYGLVTAGYFALVQRVLGLPLTIIGASVGDALLARMSRQAHDDPAAAIPFFRRTGLGLALVATPIAGAVALLGPLAFGVVFGRAWQDAGQMAALLSPWFLAALTVSPLSRIAVVYQGQGSKLLYDAASLVAVFGGIVGGFWLGFDWRGAILAFALLQVVAYAIYLAVLYRIVRRARWRSEP